MRYTPSGAISDPIVAAELLQISRAIEGLNARIYTKVYAEPAKLIDGMVVFADGTTWDPGFGEGLYRYDSGGATWVSLEDGSGGVDGNSVFVANVYLRKASAPTEPVTNDGEYNFTTNVLTPPSTGGGSADNWLTTVPAGTDPLYVSSGSFEISGATGIDSTVDWTAPIILASDGASGTDGNTSHVGSVYLRKATAPTEPVTNDGSYNFDTGVLTPPSTGGGSADNWSITVPSGTDPLYISNGLFEITGTSGVDSTVDWSAPVILASDGTAGEAAFTINYTNNSHSVPVTNLDVEDWTGSGGLFYAYEGGTLLTLDQNAQSTGYPITPGEYRLDIAPVSGDTLTEPAITGATTTEATIADWASNLTQVTVYRITAYILSAGSVQISLSVDVTLTPGDQGEDGADGPPGLPGASTITYFDDADTGLASTSAGKYGFGTSTTVGTLTWSTIVNGTSILYLVVPNLSTGSTEDYTTFYEQVVSGDVVTWYDNDAFPGRWVSWRTTGVGVAISGGYRFPVEFINHFDNGDTNDVPGIAGNDVEVRWSRVNLPPTLAINAIGGTVFGFVIDTNDAEVKYKVDSDGTVYGTGGIKTVTNSTSRGTWLQSGLNSAYEVRLTKSSGLSPIAGPALATWLAASSDQEWRWEQTTIGVDQFEGLIEWRHATTLEVLGSAALSVWVEVEPSG